MKVLLLFFFLATIIATCQGASHPVVGHHKPGFNCLSWRLTVETNNIRDWAVVPQACVSYVGHYMLDYQYREDAQAVADAAYNYAKSTPLIKDFRNTWIFDLGDTVLSSLPYYAQPDIAFGKIVVNICLLIGTKYNSTKFAIWEMKGIAPAVPGILDLYRKLQSIGYKIVIISGRSESLRAVTIKNLKNLGFTNWEKLILKQTSAKGTTSLVFKEKKRNELIGQGYRIIGNVGDQWSDLLGEHAGYRTFKVPNPMYYD
ncbi:hypothetical protein ACB092_05G062100 [Castanea dentata]